jgi:hypothetical protein
MSDCDFFEKRVVHGHSKWLPAMEITPTRIRTPTQVKLPFTGSKAHAIDTPPIANNQFDIFSRDPSAPIPRLHLILF